MDWLISTYGKISESEMLNREQNLTALTYDTSKPVDFVFNEIDIFCDLSELSSILVSDRRKRQFAYVIFQKSRAFLDSLKKWNARPDATKTYQRMKEFMREEMSALEAVGALTIQDSLNQVEILKAIQQQQEELTQNMEQRMQVNLVEALAQYGHMERDLNTAVPVTPSATDVNAVLTATPQDLAIHKTLEELTAKIEALTTSRTRNTNPNGEGLPTVNPRTGRPYKRYCWTHGCCAHWGRHCNAKKPGHQDDATFKDRKGGSNKGCLPVVS